jgi:hypothetical protein
VEKSGEVEESGRSGKVEKSGRSGEVRGVEKQKDGSVTKEGRKTNNLNN